MNLPMPPDLVLDDLESSLRWFHAEVSPAELALLVTNATERLDASQPSEKLAQLPLVACQRGRPVAGCYFKLLSGNVATLGGARAEAGWEQSAVDLIRRQIKLLSDLGLPQIQAIVRTQDVATAELVRRAGMKQLAEIEHLWLDVLASYSLAGNASAEAATAEAAPQPAPRWRPAQSLDHNDLAQLIEQTFADTLDCPALNGRRTPVEVLDGFLDGRTLNDSSLHWELLQVDANTVGCLLLQLHDNQLMELVYMGLVPAARGRGLGKAMVARAIEVAHRWGCCTLVVAVDCANWPALAAYRAWGFEPHQRLQVWLVPNS